MAIKILHFSDIHARDNDIDEIKKCLEEIVQVASTERPDLITCAGDVFDSQNVKLDSKSAKLIFNVFSDLADIAPVVVVIGTPSHDGTAAEVLRHIKAKHEVWVSGRPEQFCMVKNGMFTRCPEIDDDIACVITMVPTPTKQFFNSDSDIKGTDNEIAQAMGAMFAGFGASAADDKAAGIPHVLVGHFQVGGAFISETQQLNGMDIEISREQCGYAQADVVMLGHIHKAQQIGQNIFYSGSIYRKDFGEMDDKGFYLHEIDDAGFLSSRFIETPTRKLIRISHDFTQDDGDGFPSKCKKVFDNMAGAIIRVEMKVYQDDAIKIEKDKIISIFEGAAEVDVRIIRIPRENVRSAHILKLFTLREKIQEMASLKSETVPGSILAKADFLENMTTDQVLAGAIAGGAA